jgi:hypothetical protein
MRRLAGAQFDPRVIAAFEELDADQLAERNPAVTWLDSPRHLRAVS